MADASKSYIIPAFVGGHPVVQEPITLVNATAAEVTLLAGTVLGRITASRKYAAHAPAASDGSESARRILVEDVTIPASGEAKTVAYSHGEFRAAGLTWASGITTTQKNTAIDSLADAGLFVK